MPSSIHCLVEVWYLLLLAESLLSAHSLSRGYIASAAILHRLTQRRHCCCYRIPCQSQ
jgi:hypothetical protein